MKDSMPSKNPEIKPSISLAIDFKDIENIKDEKEFKKAILKKIMMEEQENIDYEIFLLEDLLEFIKKIGDEEDPVEGYKKLRKNLWLLDKPDFPTSVYLARLNVINRINPHYRNMVETIEKIVKKTGESYLSMDTEFVRKSISETEFLRFKKNFEGVKKAIARYYDYFEANLTKKIKDTKELRERFKDKYLFD